jgi:NAD-dependent SIR2 family protein deacetylase
VITQNVDGLHQLAGSKRVVELHGRLAQVRCLQCGSVEDRAHLQDRLRELNPGLPVAETILAPDGDAEAGAAAEDSFRVAACQACGGVLKPDVVFFGENIPRASLDLAWSMFEEARTLLVLGSSLSVSSGQRFVERATVENKPVGIINRGPTRGDAQATLRLDGRLGELLPALESALGSA